MRKFYFLFLLIITLCGATEGKCQVRLPSSPDGEEVLVKCYPNPAITVINFDFQKPFDKIYAFQIFNFLGKKVYESPAAEQRTTVNVSDFFRGVYIFQLKDQTGKILMTGKFQVSK